MCASSPPLRATWGAGARGQVPRRPVLPPACAARARAAAAGAAQRHPGAGRILGEDLALRNGTAPPELAPDALACWPRQPWRGNIRELRNVLEQAVMRSDARTIDAEQLARVLRRVEAWPRAGDGPPPRPTPTAKPVKLPAPLAEQVAELERKRHRRRPQGPWRQQAGHRAAAGHLARHAVRTSAGKP